LSESLLTIRLADLERGKTHYEWELPLLWLRRVFDGTEATVDTSGKLAIDASVTSRQVVVKGHAVANVTMPCARTLDPVSIDLSAEVSLVLRPAATSPEMHATTVGSATKRNSSSNPAKKAAELPKRKPAHWPERELPEDEAAEDVYQGELIELDGFVREFLLLELPLMPLRSDLRFEERPAIPRSPEVANGAANPPPLDPRLRPLAEIASRLKKTTKE
jgi:uncharacterized protein